MNRQIKEIHIHCSATRKNNITADEIRRWHTSAPRSWSDIGYHYVITATQLEFGRPLHRIPASARGHNKYAAAICYVGGLNPETGKPEDTRTPRQKELLIKLIKQLKHIYPKATIHGHRDLSVDKDGDGVEKHEWMKSCPCFDAELEYLEFQPKGFKPKSKAAKDYIKNEKAKG
tara:strand:+ start:320 stop:841 length:522 start_codon:yes stop_codon:yes gene_type:complete